MELEFATTIQKAENLNEVFISASSIIQSLKGLKTDFKTVDIDLNTKKCFYAYRNVPLLFHEDLQIQFFIEKYNLREAIDETFILINNFFSSYEIKLELYKDHEWDKETLFIYVLTDLPIRESAKITTSMFKHLKALKNRTFCKYVSVVDKKK